MGGEEYDGATEVMGDEEGATDEMGLEEDETAMLSWIGDYRA